MISSYEELLQYVRKLENALDVREEGGITTTEVGGHLEVDGNVTANNTPHLYLLTFNVSDTYVSILTSVKTGFNGEPMNEDISDYTIVTLTDDKKAILLEALKSSVEYFINISTDVPIARCQKDSRQINFKDTGADYDFRIAWANNDVIITDNIYDDTIAIFEEQIL